MAKSGPIVVAFAAGIALLTGATLSVRGEVRAANERLASVASEEKPAAKIATADDAELAYCTPEFKQVLARVIHACGLSGTEGRCGC